MSKLYDEIRQRLTRQFQRVAEGDDIPPAARFRLEGLLEAAVISQEADKPALQALLAERHVAILGDTLEARLGEDWERWHPFPEIPVFLNRAPVSPSTSD
ncbi:hypothetical protein R0137_16630 [Congregibacter brevis]|uniref:Uncharacterized protein n=1 Tax=Congregibacter brevis TaxID=3081201 RepID=A0ABZ0ICM4_9GAMM|nr:hypothetical protein R0137_16630 [Congregibacter sp. IMCC45268]